MSEVRYIRHCYNSYLSLPEYLCLLVNLSIRIEWLHKIFILFKLIEGSNTVPLLFYTTVSLF